MPTTNLGLETILPSDPVSPDPINGNMEKLDALGLDYVVAQGTSGSWRYRRWKSGTYECWGRYSQQSVSPTVQQDDTNGLASFSMTYPVTFVAVPVCLVTARVDGRPQCAVTYVEHGTSAATWYVGWMQWDAGADVECNVYAIGRVR